jgi:hypothetical protein
MQALLRALHERWYSLLLNPAPGNQGDITKVAKRTVRRSMFPRIPENVFCNS